MSDVKGHSISGARGKHTSIHTHCLASMIITKWTVPQFIILLYLMDLILTPRLGVDKGQYTFLPAAHENCVICTLETQHILHRVRVPIPLKSRGEGLLPNFFWVPTRTDYSRTIPYLPLILFSTPLHAH